MSKQQPQQQPKAIVVGAGLSGLACARELQHLGWDVLVIEARNRAGGRVCTEAFEVTGHGIVPVDTGASFIHGITDNPVAKLALQSCNRDLHACSHCPLFDEEGKELETKMDEDVESIFNLALAQASKRRKRFPNESLEDAIKNCVNLAALNKQEQRVFNWHLSNLEYSVNADLSEVRNNGWDADDPFGLLGAHCLVGGGMGAVTEVLAKQIGRIEFNTRALSIDYTGGSKGAVSVRCQTGSRETKTFTAQACVCTLPLGVLKRGTVKFSPALPADKLESIRALGFGTLNKISLVFAERFWTVQELFGYCSKERGYFPIFFSNCEGDGPVLTCLLSGSSALDLEQCGKEFLTRQVLIVLRKIFGNERVAPVLATTVTRWHADEFARGSYSFVSIESSPRDYDVLARPLRGTTSALGPPTLFFAGEATNRMFPASVHGAFFSGVREARRMHALHVVTTAMTAGRVRELSSIVREEDVMTKEAFADFYSPQPTFPIKTLGRGGVVVPSAFPASQAQEEEEQAADAGPAAPTKTTTTTKRKRRRMR